jgi:hypothetical protein
MIGYKNEFFEIIESAGRSKNRSRLWKCRCKCGNFTILDTNNITSKRIKSCGCSRKGINKGNKFGFKHGLTKHKENSHPLYNARNRIITRCYNAKKRDYPYYQGKGIRVFSEWIKNPLSFYKWSLDNGWKKGLSLDRIDPNGDYEPNNCQWITTSENLKRMHKMKKENFPIIKRKVFKGCFRCGCTAEANSLCKRKMKREGKKEK